MTTTIRSLPTINIMCSLYIHIEAGKHSAGNHIRNGGQWPRHDPTRSIIMMSQKAYELWVATGGYRH